MTSKFNIFRLTYQMYTQALSCIESSKANEWAVSHLVK